MKYPMTKLKIAAAIILLLAGSATAAQAPIPIVIGTGASSVEKIAADELSTHLEHLYPDQRFPVRTSAARGATRIVLGTLQSQTPLDRYVPAGQLVKPESFVVTTAKDGTLRNRSGRGR